MALQILERILSVFRTRSEDTNKRGTVSKKQQPADSPYPVANELPPPYSENETLKTLEPKKGLAPQDSDRFVQVCPHDTLSFERLQRIANLPNFKTNCKKVDALTSSSDHHYRGHDKDTKDPQDSCKPLGDDVSTLAGSPEVLKSLKGFGTYTWKPSSPSPGIMLSFHWEMRCLDSAKVKCDSPAQLQALLEKTGIWLCPHKKITELDIVNRIYNIINPLGKPVDPIDRYITKELGHDCKRCGTKIKVYKSKDGSNRTCRVDAKRFLGEAEVEDAVWLAHCSSS